MEREDWALPDYDFDISLPRRRSDRQPQQTTLILGLFASMGDLVGSNVPKKRGQSVIAPDFPRPLNVMADPNSDLLSRTGLLICLSSKLYIDAILLHYSIPSL